MADVIVRIRPDGVRQIVRSSEPLSTGERHALLMTTLFVSGGHFLSGLMPAGVLAAIAASCAFAELVGVLSSLAQRRRPVALVHELPRRRLGRGVQSSPSRP